MQPAWVLHRRAYGDGGFLVELFTLQTGRLTVMLRGARRKARGGSSVGLAQPFIPLLVEFGGRSELKLLKRIEAVGGGIQFQGRALFSGLYVNELLTRLLPSFDPHPALFARYGDLLPRLIDSSDELALRELELALLDELGYGVVFDRDSDGEAIDAFGQYRFDPSLGFVRARFAGEAAVPAASYQGKNLKAIDEWLTKGICLDHSAGQTLKHVMREVLAGHLGGRPLRSRDMLREFLRGRSVPSQTAEVSTKR